MILTTQFGHLHKMKGHTLASSRRWLVTLSWKYMLWQFNSQGLVNAVWVFVSAGELHPALFNKMVAHIVSENNLGQFNPQNLANIVWTFIKAEGSHPRFFNTVVNHIVSERTLAIQSIKSCQSSVVI